MNRRVGAVTGVAMVVVGSVGLLDAVFTEERDFAALFALVALLGLLQCIAAALALTTVELRSDVARWLTERSHLTGEPAGRLADRAITAYRAALAEDGVADPPGTGASG